MSHLETVKSFVIENFLFGDGDDLQDDTSFLKNGIIDSTGVLELISFLEDTFEVLIEDDELVPENLDNLTNVSGFLDRKLSEGSSDAA